MMIALLAVTALPLFAAPPKTFTQEESAWLKDGLAANEVNAYLERYAKEFAEGREKAPISPTTGRLYLGRLQRYAKYYFFEYDTRIDLAWFRNVEKYMKALVDARSKLQDLEAAGKKATPEYQQLAAYYVKTAAALVQGVKNPTKMTDPRKLKILAAEKKAILDALEKAAPAARQSRK
jgi:hypothetical protein